MSSISRGRLSPSLSVLYSTYVPTALAVDGRRVDGGETKIQTEYAPG